MIILGIDPGTTSIGYALLRRGNPPALVDAGLFPIRSRSTGERLKELHQKLAEIAQKYTPDAMALERVFFAKNTKTALAVAEARGVLLLTAALLGINVFEYTPLEVKKIVTGEGNADKTQVKKMVGLTLREAKDLRARDDVFDAIAIALACCFDKRVR